MPLPRILSTKYRGKPSKVDIAYAIAWAKRQVARLEKTIQEKANSLATAGVPTSKGVRQFHYKQLWRDADITLKRDSVGRWTVDLTFGDVAGVVGVRGTFIGFSFLASSPDHSGSVNNGVTSPAWWPTESNPGGDQGVAFFGSDAYVKSLSISSPTDVALQNVTPVNATPIATRCVINYLSDYDAHDPTKAPLGENRQAISEKWLELGLAQPWQAMNGAKHRVIINTPPELTALGVYPLIAVSAYVIAVDKIFNKITFVCVDTSRVVATGSYGVDQLDQVSGVFGAVQKNEAMGMVAITVPLSAWWRPSDSEIASDRFFPTRTFIVNDVPAGGIPIVEWNGFSIPTAAIPTEDGAFTVGGFFPNPSTLPPAPFVITGGTGQLRDLELTGTIVDGVAGVVSIKCFIEIETGGSLRRGIDLTDQTLQSVDMRPFFTRPNTDPRYKDLTVDHIGCIGFNAHVADDGSSVPRFVTSWLGNQLRNLAGQGNGVFGLPFDILSPLTLPPASAAIYGVPGAPALHPELGSFTPPFVYNDSNAGAEVEDQAETILEGNLFSHPFQYVFYHGGWRIRHQGLIVDDLGRNVHTYTEVLRRMQTTAIRFVDGVAAPFTLATKLTQASGTSQFSSFSWIVIGSVGNAGTQPFKDQAAGRKVDTTLPDNGMVIRSDTDSGVANRAKWNVIGPSNLMEDEKALTEVNALDVQSSGMEKYWWTDEASGLLFQASLPFGILGRRINVIQRDTSDVPSVIFQHPENDTTSIDFVASMGHTGLWVQPIEENLTSRYLRFASGADTRIDNDAVNRIYPEVTYLIETTGFTPGGLARPQFYMTDELPPSWHRITTVGASRFSFASLTWRDAGGLGIHGSCVALVKAAEGLDPGYTEAMEVYIDAIQAQPQVPVDIAAAKQGVLDTITVVYNNFASDDVIIRLGINDRWVVTK